MQNQLRIQILLRTLALAALSIYIPACTAKKLAAPITTPNTPAALAPAPTSPAIQEPSRTQETITAKVGETFTVTLDSNPTTGVSWFINIAALETSPIQYTAQEYVRSPNPNPNGIMMGVGGQLVLHFKAVSQGPTLIRLSAQGFGGEVYKLHNVRVTIQ